MKTAFLFPGQGSQHVCMGVDLAREFKVVKETFEEASDTISFDLLKLCTDGPESDLALTQNTQPSILSLSTAILRVLESETGLKPDILAGHSLGEYSALVCNKALAFSDAVSLVRKRGMYMQDASQKGLGSMAALMGLSSENADSLCREVVSEMGGDAVLVVANYNSSTQLVLSGHTKAIHLAIEKTKQDGPFKCRMAKELPVSAPFHSPLMKPVREKMSPDLNATHVGDLSCSYIANVHAKEITDSTQVVALLVEQLDNPVRWLETQQLLNDSGVERCFEIGPGKVLTGLLKREYRHIPSTPVNSLESIKQLSE